MFKPVAPSVRLRSAFLDNISFLFDPRRNGGHHHITAFSDSDMDVLRSLLQSMAKYVFVVS